MICSKNMFYELKKSFPCDISTQNIDSIRNT